MEKLVTLKCPHCSLPALAELETAYSKFIIYTCPECKSNVVYYKNRVDIITNNLLEELIKGGRVKFCGNISFEKKSAAVKIKLPPSVKRLPKNIKKITKDDLIDLRILLETESDIDTIISQL